MRERGGVLYVPRERVIEEGVLLVPRVGVSEGEGCYIG